MKYLQITLVMGLFFGFVLLTNVIDLSNLGDIFSDNEDQVVVGNSTYSNTVNSVNTKPKSTSNSNSSLVTTTTENNRMGNYKDGEYSGTSENAYYGYVKVKAVISGGKITDVVFLEYPTHNRTSDYINSQAKPLLAAAAISAQSANVGKVSGASYTSMAFRNSLVSALAQAK